MNPSELERFFVRPEQTLLQVMECVNKNARGIALVVDRERRLLDTITDGDLRRAVLAAKDLQQSAGCFRGQPHQPITAPLSSTPHQLLALMRQHKLRHIPLLEPNGVVADMALMETWWSTSTATSSPYLP